MEATQICFHMLCELPCSEKQWSLLGIRFGHLEKRTGPADSNGERDFYIQCTFFCHQLWKDTDSELQYETQNDISSFTQGGCQKSSSLPCHCCGNHTKMASSKWDKCSGKLAYTSSNPVCDDASGFITDIQCQPNFSASSKKGDNTEKGIPSNSVITHTSFSFLLFLLSLILLFMINVCGIKHNSFLIFLHCLVFLSLFRVLQTACRDQYRKSCGSLLNSQWFHVVPLFEFRPRDFLLQHTMTQKTRKK